MMVENGDMSFVENDLMIYGDLMFDNFDELLDFSSEEEAKLLSEPLPCPSSSSDLDPPPPPPPTSNQVDNSLSADDDNATLLCDDLDVAQLEWLSHFVEESFSPTVAPIVELPVTTTAVKKEAAINGVGHQYRTPSPISVLEQSSGGLQSNYSPSSSPSSSSSGILLPGGGPRKGQHHSPLPSPLGQQEPAARRRRSKRARPTALWASNSISLIPFPRAPESGESGSDSNSTTAKKKKLKDGYDSLVVIPPVIHVGGVGGGGGGGRGGEEESPVMAPARRCMHCDVQKTPQWRAGPMGPKTLCNACGVRYKSGRLFPEYRPAASPTFSSTIHSNSHKKVVEMRNKVEPTFNDVAPLALKGCELLNYIRENNNGVGKKQQNIDRA